MSTLLDLFDAIAGDLNTFIEAGQSLAQKLRDYSTEHSDDSSTIADVEQLNNLIPEVLLPSVNFPIEKEEDYIPSLFDGNKKRAENRKYTPSIGTVIRISKIANSLKVPVKAVKYVASRLSITPFYPEEYTHKALYVSVADAIRIRKYIRENLL